MVLLLHFILVHLLHTLEELWVIIGCILILVLILVMMTIMVIVQIGCCERRKMMSGWYGRSGHDSTRGSSGRGRWIATMIIMIMIIVIIAMGMVVKTRIEYRALWSCFFRLFRWKCWSGKKSKKKIGESLSRFAPKCVFDRPQQPQSLIMSRHIATNLQASINVEWSPAVSTTPGWLVERVQTVPHGRGHL